MKKIEAIIKPFKLEAVKDALADIGVAGLTVTEVKWYGPQCAPTAGAGAGEFQADFESKTKIEIILTNEKFVGALHAIVAAARTGRIGDGRICVLPVEQTIRIRTGETAEAAI